MSLSSPIKAVVFDLGGVLVELVGFRLLEPYLPEGTALAEFTHNWIHDPAVTAFEQGRMESEPFIHEAIHSLQLHTDAETFRQVMLDFIRGPFPGLEALLHALRQQMPVGILSNTNVLHWTSLVKTYPYLNEVPHLFLSYEMGLCKPEPAIFQRMVEGMGVEASEILYFDDHPANIKAAMEQGIQAVQVVGLEEVKVELQHRGLIPGSP